MEVIYSNQPSSTERHSIFLAGPTPRSKDVPSWRPQALELLKELDWDGVVMIPEYDDWNALESYEGQIEWEQNCLHACGKVVFWVPRDLETMPAFTTNVEFGYWIAKDPKKIMYGRPDGSPKCAYLDWMYLNHSKREPEADLQTLLKKTVNALDLIKSVRSLEQ